MAKFKKSLELRPEENEEVNCRLQNGLNVNCLVEIFKYLDTDELITLGTMNSFYKNIINDYIIRNHMAILHLECGKKRLKDF